MSTTRTVGAGQRGQHVDRRATGIDVRDHLRGHLRRGTPTPRSGRHAVVTGEHHHPRAARIGFAADRRLGTTTPISTVLRGGRARPAAWSGCLGAPGRRPRRRRRIGCDDGGYLHLRDVTWPVLDGHDQLSGDDQHHPVAHAAANRWLSAAEGVGELPPGLAVAGTTVSPTSGLTSTSGEPERADRRPPRGRRDLRRRRVPHGRPRSRRRGGPSWRSSQLPTSSIDQLSGCPRADAATAWPHRHSSTVVHVRRAAQSRCLRRCCADQASSPAAR